MRVAVAPDLVGFRLGRKDRELQRVLGGPLVATDRRARMAGNPGLLRGLLLVGAVNWAATFPACRAVVHHGGAGTTAVGLHAGVPTLILSTWGDQKVWGTRVKRLKVGSKRRFSATTRESLVADLRTIQAPEYIARARELATRMSNPAESATVAADLMENFTRTPHVG